MSDQEVVIRISAKNLTEEEFKKARAAVTGLEKDVADSGSVTDMVGGKLKTLGPAIVGALSVGAVTAAIKSYTDFTGQLTDLSAKTGMSTDALQRLQFAAEQNGGSLEQVTSAVTKLGANLAGGNTSAVGAVNALGLSLADIRAMQPDQAFTTIADAIAKVPDPMDRSKLAMDLFGKSGAELLPMMTGNLSETAAEADRLGLVLSEDMVRAGDEFGDTLDKLTLVGQSVIAQVLSPMVPALTAVAGWLADKVPAAISGTRGAFDFLIETGMQVQVWFNEFLLSVLEAGNKLPWLGEKLGMTSDNISAVKANIQVAKDALVIFKDQTEAAAASNERQSGTLQTLNLDYDTNAKAAKKATDEKAKAERELNELIAKNIAQQIKDESAYRTHQNKLSDERAKKEIDEIAAKAAREEAARLALEEADRKALQKMLQEKFDQEREAEDKSKKLRDDRLAHVRTTFDTMLSSANDHFAKMITGTEGFKEGFTGIWDDIKSSFKSILGGMLSQFKDVFLKGIMDSLSGGSGGGGGLKGLIGGAVDAAMSFIPGGGLISKGIKSIGKIFGFSGGTVARPTLGIVAEDRPETVAPTALIQKNLQTQRELTSYLTKRPEPIRIPGAADGVFATSPIVRVFGEGGEPELGGPLSFMEKVLAGAMRRAGTSGSVQDIRVVLNVDGRRMTETVVQHMPQLLARHGVRP